MATRPVQSLGTAAAALNKQDWTPTGPAQEHQSGRNEAVISKFRRFRKFEGRLS